MGRWVVTSDTKKDFKIFSIHVNHWSIVTIPVSRSFSLGSVRSTGMKSLSQMMVGSGFPLALHNMTVFRSFSTAFSVGLSVMRGYPLGTKSTENRKKH